MEVTETETELTEREVTRVYCDDCGDDCTDSHNNVKQQLCDNCTDATTMEKVSANMPRLIPEAKERDASLHIFQSLFVIIGYPFILFITLSGDIRTDHAIQPHDTNLLKLHVLGAMVYGFALGELLLYIMGAT